MNLNERLALVQSATNWPYLHGSSIQKKKWMQQVTQKDATKWNYIFWHMVTQQWWKLVKSTFPAHTKAPNSSRLSLPVKPTTQTTQQADGTTPVHDGWDIPLCLMANGTLCWMHLWSGSLMSTSWLVHHDTEQCGYETSKETNNSQRPWGCHIPPNKITLGER